MSLALTMSNVSMPSRRTSQATASRAAVITPARNHAFPQTAHVNRDADQVLVKRAQAGDQAAFELLVWRHQNRIIQLVQRFVGEADAPDVAQECFIKAYRAIGSFRGQSSFFTWLYRVAVNCAKNHLVARARRPPTVDLDVADIEKCGHEERLSDVATPESRALANEIQATVASVLEKLPTELRGAITLREIQGLSYEEIAQVLHCPTGTVRSRIFRAREVIDSAIRPLLVDG